LELNRISETELNFRRRPKFFPGVRDHAVHGNFRFVPTVQKIQIIPEFAQYRLRLMLDFLEQNFLRAHAGKISRFPTRSKACLALGLPAADFSS
jgi:hypothetical protein